jgi:AcrR family transcriptional regulator
LKATAEEKRRTQIALLLDATDRVLTRGGARGVTHASVAAEAGVSAATLYRYFPAQGASRAKGPSLMAAWEERMLDEAARVAHERARALSGSDHASEWERVFLVAHAAADVIARAARRCRFGPGEAAFFSREAERVARFSAAADSVHSALVSLGREVLPRDAKLASRLVVEACALVSFSWGGDRPEEVEAGRFQCAMAAMISRYLVARPGDRPPPIEAATPAPVPTATSTLAAREPAPEHAVVAEDVREPRKAPQQARSAETIAVILEATRRVVQRDGVDGVTTTRVAREAGVSVGSLYQYFATKEALLAGWEEHVLSVMLHGLVERVGETMMRVSTGGPLGARGAYTITRVTIDTITENARAHRFSAIEVRFFSRTRHMLDLANRAAVALGTVIDLERPHIHPADTREAALMLVTTAVPLCLSWPSAHPDDLADKTFQRELSTMLVRYLAKDPGETAFEDPETAA